MANRYWVGGSGTWGSTQTTNWSDTSGGAGGFSVPTNADDVFFNAQSSSGSYTVTVQQGNTINANNIEFVPPASGTLTLTCGPIPTNGSTLFVNGDFIVAGSGVTFDLRTTGASFTQVTLSGTSKVFDTNNNPNIRMDVRFNGSYSLGGNFINLPYITQGTPRFEISFGSGSLNTNNFNITTPSLSIGTGKTLILGSSQVTLTAVGGVFFCDSTAILDTGTSNIILSDTSTSGRTFQGGGKIYNKLTIGGTTGSSTLTITGNNTFNEIVSTKTVAHTIIFPNGTTNIGTWNMSGSPSNIVTLSRTGGSGQFTINKIGGGFIDTNYISVSNCLATPLFSFFAGNNSTDGGNNLGVYFNTYSGYQSTWPIRRSTFSGFFSQ
jgi:hypothetical protein